HCRSRIFVASKSLVLVQLRLDESLISRLATELAKRFIPRRAQVAQFVDGGRKKRELQPARETHARQRPVIGDADRSLSNTRVASLPASNEQMIEVGPRNRSSSFGDRFVRNGS